MSPARTCIKQNRDLLIKKCSIVLLEVKIKTPPGTFKIIFGYQFMEKKTVLFRKQYWFQMLMFSSKSRISVLLLHSLNAPMSCFERY